MKREHDVACRKCKNGVCFSVCASRLEDFLGHRLYRCDKCGTLWKFVRDDPEPTLVDERQVGP